MNIFPSLQIRKTKYSRLPFTRATSSFLFESLLFKFDPQNIYLWIIRRYPIVYGLTASLNEITQFSSPLEDEVVLMKYNWRSYCSFV